MKKQFKIGLVNDLYQHVHQHVSMPLFLNALKTTKIQKKVLFIQCSPQSVKFEQIEKLAKMAQEAGMKVYLPAFLKNKISTYKKLDFVKTGTIEYFRALASSRYVYTNEYIHWHYMKRKGQILIVDLPSENRSKLSNRINMDRLYSRADWVISKEKSDSDSILKEISTGKLGENDPKTGKKNLLFLVNMDYYNEMYCYFEHISRTFNFDQVDVTLCIANKFSSVYKKELEKLEPRIHIVTKMGSVLCNEAAENKMKTMKNDEYYLMNLDEAEKQLPKNMFQNEVRRIFGDIEFDYIFNMKFDTFYWRMLLYVMKGKKIIYDVNNYTGTVSQVKYNKLKYISTYDKVLYANRDCMEQALQVGVKELGEKAQVIMPIQHKSVKDKVDFEIVELNGNSYYIVNQKKVPYFDTYSVVLVPVSVQNCSFMILNPEFNEQEAMDLIHKIEEQEKSVVVFDFSQIIATSGNSSSDNTNIYYYTDYDVYDELISILGNEIDYQMPESCSNRKSIFQQFQ